MGKILKDPSYTPPPSAGTKARRTYDALLESMERCLEAGGYPAASSAAVAAEAGVSSGTFYVYFTDRDDALAALFALRLQGLLDSVRSALRIDVLLDDGLEHVLTRAVDVVLAHYHRHAATFRAALVQLPSSPAIRDAYWSAHRETQDELVTFLRRAQTAGMVRDADPELLAQSLLVVVQGANSPLLLARPRAQRTRQIAGELVQMLVALLVPPAPSP